MIDAAELVEWVNGDAADMDQLGQLEAAAVDFMERYSGRRLQAPTSVVEPIAWRGGVAQLANELSGDVTLEQWTGSTWEAVDSSSYYVDGRLVYWTGTTPAALPARTRATYTAGYEAGSEPEVAKQAVRMLVAHWWENREAAVTGAVSVEVDLGLQWLLRALG